MFLNLVKNRFSVRFFNSEIPSKEEIENVLKAGRLAPSWVNVQPWHFIVVQNDETKELLSKLSHGQPHVKTAPIIIVCCGDKNAWKQENYKAMLESRPEITKEKIDRIMGLPALNPELVGEEAVTIRTVEEVTYATAYMTISAQEQGLGSCVIGGIGNEITKSIPDVYKEVRKKLLLPDGVIIVSLLLLGYPSQDIKKPEKSRKNSDQIISYETY